MVEKMDKRQLHNQKVFHTLGHYSHTASPGLNEKLIGTLMDVECSTSKSASQSIAVIYYYHDIQENLKNL